MHKAIDFHIQGLVPLIQHNGQLCDPLNSYARRMKEITGKRKKTDADYQALADLEWEGGLYLGDQGEPVIPGENLEAAFVEGGKKARLGSECKAGIICDGAFPLIYDGPKTLEKLRKDPRFRDTRKAKIKQNSVMRTRPIFPVWQLKFTVHYMTDLLNPAQVTLILETIGRIIGICDQKPKYGRFTIV